MPNTRSGLHNLHSFVVLFTLWLWMNYYNDDR